MSTEETAKKGDESQLLQALLNFGNVKNPSPKRSQGTFKTARVSISDNYPPFIHPGAAWRMDSPQKEVFNSI